MSQKEKNDRQIRDFAQKNRVSMGYDTFAYNVDVDIVFVNHCSLLIENLLHSVYPHENQGVR